MSIDTLPEIIRCNLCGHSAELHRYASPTPGCAACPDMQCVGARPAQLTLRERFLHVLANTVDYPTPDAAWRLVLDAWRVIEVASARGDVPATPNREEWMAALRVAIFRLDYGVTEPAGEVRHGS